MFEDTFEWFLRIFSFFIFLDKLGIVGIMRIDVDMSLNGQNGNIDVPISWHTLHTTWRTLL